MANDKDTKIEGEGSYSGARDYDARTQDFIKRKGAQIESLAEDAEHALDGAKADELKRAEDAGKSRAKHRSGRSHWGERLTEQRRGRPILTREERPKTP